MAGNMSCVIQTINLPSSTQSLSAAIEEAIALHQPTDLHQPTVQHANQADTQDTQDSDRRTELAQDYGFKAKLCVKQTNELKLAKDYAQQALNLLDQ